MKGIAAFFKVTSVMGVAGMLLLLWWPEDAGNGANAGSSEIEKSGRSYQGGEEGTLSGSGFRKARSLNELKELLSDFSEQIEDSFDPLEPPAVVKAFLSDLSLEEKITLAKWLYVLVEKGLGESDRFKDVSQLVVLPRSFLNVLVVEWGREDPASGFQYAQKLKGDSDLFNFEFSYCLFWGWSSVAPLEAWRYFEPQFRGLTTNRDVELGFKQTQANQETAAIILGNLAGRFPDVALGVLKGGKSRLNVHDVRDAIIKGLPPRCDWRQLAEDLSGRGFVWNDGTYIIEKGGGSVLFARWAHENPEQAIRWYDKKPDQGFGKQLHFRNWYELFPETAIPWIDEHLAQGDPEYQRVCAEMAEMTVLDQTVFRWAQNNPNSGERFEIFKAASAVDEPDPFSEYSVHGGPFEVAFLEKQLPAFRLTPEQEAEIRGILKRRKAAEDAFQSLGE